MLVLVERYSSRDWRHPDSLAKSYNLASTQNQPEVFIQVAELSAKKVAYNLKALCIVTRGVFQLNDPGRSSQAVASTYEEASLERLTEVADVYTYACLYMYRTETRVLKKLKYPEDLYFVCIMTFTWSKFEFHRKTDKDTMPWMKRNETKRKERMFEDSRFVDQVKYVLRSILVLRFRWQSRIPSARSMSITSPSVQAWIKAALP